MIIIPWLRSKVLFLYLNFHFASLIHWSFCPALMHTIDKFYYLTTFRRPKLFYWYLFEFFQVSFDSMTVEVKRSMLILKSIIIFSWSFLWDSCFLHYLVFSILLKWNNYILLPVKSSSKSKIRWIKYKFWHFISFDIISSLL